MYKDALSTCVGSENIAPPSPAPAPRVNVSLREGSLPICSVTLAPRTSAWGVTQGSTLL
jgi:hypothetical protein